MTTPSSIPVVELLRVSTESQAGEDRAGLPAQHAVNTRTCETYGLRVVETVEVVVSGAAVVGTDAMDRVLLCVTSGRAHGIVVAEYSRLFRPDRWTDLAILQVFEEHGAKIYIPAGPIDLSSELGFVQATVNNLLAAIERRRIRERMMRGKEELRRRGAHVAGGVGMPFGFAYSKRDGWSYTHEIELVRELFRRFLAGERNYSALADAVGLSRTNVRFLLTNPVYSGWRVYTLRHAPGKRRVHRAPEDVLRVRLPLEPIVSEEDFALVQAIVENKRASRPQLPPRDDFTYRGFLVCAEDGLPMYPHCAGEGRFFYRCRSHHPTRRPEGTAKCFTGFLNRDILEPMLNDAISERLTDPDVLLEAIGEYERSRAASWRANTGDRATLEARAIRARERRDRVLELFLDGDIDRAEKDRRLAGLADEIGAAEAVLAAAQPAVTPELSPDDVMAVVDAFAQWAALGIPDRRQVLESLGPSFYVRRLGRRGNFRVDGVRFPWFGLIRSGDSVRRSRTPPTPRRCRWPSPPRAWPRW